MRIVGKDGGTARCGQGPRADGLAGGCAGPELSGPLSTGPEAPSGEEAARADQRESAGAAAAAGRHRGAAGRAPREVAEYAPELSGRLNSLPLCAGAGQARERRSAGIDGSARAGRAAWPGAR